MSRNRLTVLIASVTLATLNTFAADSRPLTDEEILKKVTWPKDQFNATVFASPPNISYPIFISAAPDGTLFVGCDENGSLDRKAGRGKIIMCRDTDGDGRADKFTTFAMVESPRGVTWDASTRTLYVMHPPKLTAYHDDNNTGVANREEDLITGLGFGLDFRGADHTINGCRLGIDGWIYIACGDYGAVKATGKDGRSFELRGGGIARIRPDGTGLELAVRGTRNILAVAISPTLELFTRDNTNDGDDWNDRLSFNPFGAQMGYPTLFRNFADEIIPTMIDFGGGSPVGSIFVDEPVLPKEWAYGFYSVEWGRSEIDLHPLTPAGATYKAETKLFAKIPRATDLDVDGAGRLYAASWDGATFTYNGPNVGYIIGLTAKEAKPKALPEFKKLSPAELVQTIAAPSAVWRQAAQRELLVRGVSAGVAESLQKIAETDANLGARVAAIQTLKLLLGAKAVPILVALTKNDVAREHALRALGDDQRLAAQVPAQSLVAALNDVNPKVRLQAVTGLGHLGKAEAASALLERTADQDYTVRHVAVQALRWLNAREVCLSALDSSDTTVHAGALRVLQALYDPAVVDGLIKRASTRDEELRRGIYNALCRLDTKETTYSDPKMWWGTRPDTSGPIYKPERWSESEKIEKALKQALETATGKAAQALVTEILRTKVTFPGLTDLMLAKAGNDTTSRLEVMAKLISPKTPVSEGILEALGRIATSESEPVDLRAQAFRLLANAFEKNGEPVLKAYATLAAKEQTGVLGAVWEEFTRDTRLGKAAGLFESRAKDADPANRKLGATVLVNLVTSTVGRDRKAKDTAQRALDSLWKNPEQAATLLQVIAHTRATQFAPQVREQLTSANPATAQAAQATLAALGLANAGSGSAKLIGDLPYEEVLKAVLAMKGDAQAGEQLFLKQGCVLCHTLTAKEPPKGPMLGGIATRYSRTELCESILKPSAKIAQGFETQNFKLKNGEEVEGFVVKEGGDSVDVRNISGVTMMLEKGDISQRQKKDQSIMPEGLVGNITPADLAALLAFLESTKSQ